MKKWMIKFWYLLPILLVVFILAFYAEFALELSKKNVPAFVEYTTAIIVLLILIASVVSWVILLMFVATVIIVSIALFPWLPIAI